MVTKKFKTKPTRKRKNKALEEPYNIDDEIEHETFTADYLDQEKRIIGKAENSLAFLDKVDDPEMRDMLQESFTELVQKNKLPIKYKDFDEVIKHVADYSEADSTFNKLYVSKMINAITDIAKVKSMITLGQLTNRALAVFQKAADDPSLDSLEVMVSSIREIYEWMDKLENLRQKYYQVGTDRQIALMSEQANLAGQPKPRLTKEALTDIIQKINNGNKKPVKE